MQIFFLLNHFLEKIILRFSLFNEKKSGPNKNWNYGTLDNFLFSWDFFFTVVLRYNSHIIKSTRSKYTIQ